MCISIPCTLVGILLPWSLTPSKVSGADSVKEGEDSVFNLEDLHLQDDGGSLGDHSLNSLLSVAIAGRDGDASLLALASSFHTIIPANNASLANSHLKGSATLIGRVKNSS